jgi:UDP:flavonoid glycosyltransferase YjiC (YdhE family)
VSADGCSAVPARARTRVLFVAENVSLAQVVRLYVLSQCLDPARYEVWFASSGYDPLIFRDARLRRHPIRSLSAAAMLRRLERGGQLYDARTLGGYVREDLQMLERVQPALVVGDLRLSLAVSAPKLGVPYAALINAYWSPYGLRERFPLPEHPLVRLLGYERMAPHVHRAMPFVLEYLARPVNALRRRNGLPEIGSLLEVLTFGDHTLHPDVPELTPLAGAPDRHRFLGPVLWSPDVALPAALARADDRRSLVYVTLGSTGHLRVLRALLAALATLPVRVLLATAGRFRTGELPDNVIAADYVPGREAARRARLVVCNGGSSTGYQALHEGVPVLGLPFNFDQSLAMAAIERAGAGRAVRLGEASVPHLRAQIDRLLHDDAARAAAHSLAYALQRTDSAQRFVEFVHAIAP